MKMPTNYFEMPKEEMMNVDGGGVVGLNIRVSKATGNLGAETCGILAEAAVTYPLYIMSIAFVPASAVIVGSTQSLVVNAVKSGRVNIPVGVNIPFIS